MITQKKLLVFGGGLLLAAAAMQCEVPYQPSEDMSTGVQLTVSSDSSLGTVTSDPAGIDCGSVCSVQVPPGSSVTLTATPRPETDATFLGWEGPCSGPQSTCALTVNEATSVTARWMPAAPPAAPTITAVAPPFGANNVATNITITGTNFRPGATVTVGGQTCGSPVVVSSTQMTCTAPIKAATCGPQNVVVTNLDTLNAAKLSYTYKPASVAFATPVALSGTLNGPHRMIVADFNNDGSPDLAHSNQAPAGFVSVYLGSKTGAFGAAKNANVGNSPIGLAAGDINGV